MPCIAWAAPRIFPAPCADSREALLENAFCNALLHLAEGFVEKQTPFNFSGMLMAFKGVRYENYR
jgi:hypothetical protein